MNVNWLMDAELFEAYRDELVACIKQQGHEVKLIRAPSPPYRWEDTGWSYRTAFPENACVVVHGDIELVNRIHQDRRWIPGAIATVERFYCSSYYCHFGQHLLNQRYMMLPFGELLRQREFLFESFGVEDRIFVRPDSPLKLFTGQVASLQTFEADVEFMGFYEFPPESLVVVGQPRTIEREWRFVVAGEKVVAGCQYKADGKMDVSPTYEVEAMALASEIASGKYQPDIAWVIDICRTKERTYRLLEIGGFSFSDLYAGDKAAIVSAVSEVACNAWQNAQVAEKM